MGEGKPPIPFGVENSQESKPQKNLSPSLPAECRDSADSAAMRLKLLPLLPLLPALALEEPWDIAGSLRRARSTLEEGGRVRVRFSSPAV